jgi:hypothetical protein
MITATEAQAMVNEFEANLKAEKEAKVEAFIEKEVSPAIAEMAKKGKNELPPVSLPTNLNRQHFEKVLVDNGYKVCCLGASTFYTIRW